MLKTLSIAALMVMVAGVIGLWKIHALFSPSPFVIAVQAAAVGLMIWARVTFGRRSFHPGANPTAGGLVTSGPYHFIRHPIYTAACLFTWAGVVAHWSWTAAALGALVLLGAQVRIECEERLIIGDYPEYPEYSRTTKRMVPYLF